MLRTSHLSRKGIVFSQATFHSNKNSHCCRAYLQRQGVSWEKTCKTKMCSLERHGKIFLLKFMEENEHRFTPELCSDILSALKTVEQSDARALVTTNDGKFYSNGLDLEWMKEDAATRFPLLLREFERVVYHMMKLNVPTIAAVCGHAAGGGFLFAMAHDYRYMRSDRGFLYNSAVDINVVLPSGSIALQRTKLSPQVFRDVVLKGIKYTGVEGFGAGLVDSLFEGPTQTLEQAMREANVLADKPWEKPAYQGLRMAMVCMLKICSKKSSFKFYLA
ncbi:hypothetical protein SUGI_1035840 [Cryptomeria japonica]|nr:hypothetical protein SUGI_1035840 [Cryptomeria japonica]